MVKLFVLYCAWGTLLVSLVLVAVTSGSVHIPLEAIWECLLNWGNVSGQAAVFQVILFDLRLPRAIMALCVGAGLGMVGCFLQTVTRNDLADPFLFGLSSGAAAGAVMVISFWGDVLGIWTLPAASFAGAMLAAISVMLLIRKMNGARPERLVLAGLAVSFLFSALTSFLVFSGDQRAAHSVLFWSLGGLGLARWENLPLAIFGLGLLGWFGFKYHRSLDALLAGEETAQSLGVRLKYFRLAVFFVSAAATAIFVSLVGVIGFIGLMVPHLARWLVGPLHQGVISMSIFIGAALLLASDLVARVILSPQELPVGIITTALGGIFIFAILVKSKS